MPSVIKGKGIDQLEVPTESRFSRIESGSKKPLSRSTRYAKFDRHPWRYRHSDMYTVCRDARICTEYSVCSSITVPVYSGIGILQRGTEYAGATILGSLWTNSSNLCRRLVSKAQIVCDDDERKRRCKRSI